MKKKSKRFERVTKDMMIDHEKKVYHVRVPTPQSEPIRVADYLLNLPISALTGRERSELWNACAAFVQRVRTQPSGTQTGRISGAGPGNAKEVPRGQGKSAG